MSLKNLLRSIGTKKRIFLLFAGNCETSKERKKETLLTFFSGDFFCLFFSFKKGSGEMTQTNDDFKAHCGIFSWAPFLYS